MPLTPRQLRIYLLSTAALLLIIVIGFYAYARWRLHSLGRITAQKLSTEVSRYRGVYLVQVGSRTYPVHHPCRPRH